MIFEIPFDKLGNGPDKDILQEVLNGMFEESKLPAPKTVMDCFDDDTAMNVVMYIPTAVK